MNNEMIKSGAHGHPILIYNLSLIIHHCEIERLLRFHRLFSK